MSRFRPAARIDVNQPEIVAGLRAVGASVQSLATIGGGCPDLAVGLRGQNYLMEVKRPDGPPSGRALTTHERLWHLQWRGDVCIVHSLTEALRVMGLT